MRAGNGSCLHALGTEKSTPAERLRNLRLSPLQSVALECDREADVQGPALCTARILDSEGSVSGDSVVDATVSPGLDSSAPDVQLELGLVGASEFAQLTGANVHRMLAIVIDGEIS